MKYDCMMSQFASWLTIHGHLVGCNGLEITVQHFVWGVCPYAENIQIEQQHFSL